MLKQKILMKEEKFLSSKYQTKAFSQHLHLVLLQNGLEAMLWNIYILHKTDL